MRDEEKAPLSETINELEELNLATASYLSKYKIRASAHKIGKHLAQDPYAEKANPAAESSRKTWRIKRG